MRQLAKQAHSRPYAPAHVEAKQQLKFVLLAFNIVLIAKLLFWINSINTTEYIVSDRERGI